MRGRGGARDARPRTAAAKVEQFMFLGLYTGSIPKDDASKTEDDGVPEDILVEHPPRLSRPGFSARACLRGDEEGYFLLCWT